MDDPIKFKRDKVKIEGGRNLYNYTFEEETVAGEEGGEKAAQQPKGNLKPKAENTE